MAAEEIITDKTVSLVHQRARNARGWIDARANQIRLELARCEEKPFDEVIKLFGDPHAFGQQPITSLRQVGHWELLVFTKSVDSNFRAFWLAPVTWNILGYSLFCERREKWRVVLWKFQKKKLKNLGGQLYNINIYFDFKACKSFHWKLIKRMPFFWG